MKDKESQVQGDLKIIFKSSLIMFFGIVISKLLTYSYKMIIARNLGPEMYGFFSLSLAIVSLFIFISALGLDAGVLRFIPLFRSKDEKEKSSYLFKSVLWFQLFMSLIFGTLLFFLSEYISVNFFHNTGLIIFLKFFSIAVPINVLLTTMLGTIKAYERIGWYSFIFNILQNFVKVAALIIFLFLGLKSGSVIFSYISSLLLSLILAYIICKYIIREVFGKSNLSKEIKSKLFKEVFSYSWPLMFFALTFSILYWTNSFVIGYFKTVSDVGFYDVAISISMLLAITPSLFIQLFFPLATKLYFKEKENLIVIQQLSKQIGKWVFIVNLPAAIMILVFPGAFINILFGKEYLIAENALRLLTLAFLFDSIMTISSNLISVYGKTKLIFLDMIIAAAVNLFLSIFLTPRYGITGAAISTTISFLILDLLFLFQARHYLSVIPLKRKMINIFLISLIPTLIVIFIRRLLPQVNFFILAVLGIFYLLLYCLLIFYTKGLDKNDMIIISSITKKINDFKKIFSK
ncbi:MAG: oligosaccharide flippase family protein [Candidatus Nanoarchaeia archaeon]|nr:oligosaccharide flippase family protein [Candidatus Nanoarchaeia archaeon]